MKPTELPRWDGEALLGRPAWKGSLVDEDVDWKALVETRRPVTVVVGERSSQAVLAHWFAEQPSHVQVQGGADPPF